MEHRGKSHHELAPNQRNWDRERREDGEPLSDRTRILVVDDDPTFGKILHQIGLQSGVDVVVLNKIESLGALPKEHFDVAILDFDLGPVNGVEVAASLEKTGTARYSILVSQSQEVGVPIGSWPSGIKGFVQKSLGHFAIFEIALAAVEASAIEKSVRGGSL